VRAIFIVNETAIVDDGELEREREAAQSKVSLSHILNVGTVRSNKSGTILIAIGCFLPDRTLSG
jgi:hypothetical protein